jgi:hypothetical protein
MALHLDFDRNNIHGIDEGFWDSLTKHAGVGYAAGKKGMESDYEKYAPQAGPILAKVSGAAKWASQKTGIPLPLATALIASGAFGGPAAIPFAALMYFVKKPLMGAAGAVFDKTWDAGAAGINALRGQQQPKLQPEHFSFKEWLIIEEQKESWADYFGRNIGHAAGRVAGNVVGLGGKVAGVMKQSLQDIYQYVGNNPKQVAKAAFLVGIGAATGGVIGKITHDLKDMIVQNVQDYIQDVPAEEVAWLRNNMVFDKATSMDGTETQYTSDELLQRGTEGHPYMQQVGDMRSQELSGNMTSMDHGMDQSTVSHGPLSTSGVEDHKGILASMNKYDQYGPRMGDTGTSGNFSATHSTMSNHPVHIPPNAELGQVYRDVAKQMGHNAYSGPYAPGHDPASMMTHLRGLNTDPSFDAMRYGHSAGQEISDRLASPDTYTGPAAVAGAVVGATGNKKRNK